MDDFRKPLLADYGLDEMKVEDYRHFEKKIDVIKNKVFFAAVVILALFIAILNIFSVEDTQGKSLFQLIFYIIFTYFGYAVLSFFVLLIIQIFIPISDLVFIFPRLRKESLIAKMSRVQHQKYNSDLRDFSERLQKYERDRQNEIESERRRLRQFEINYWKSMTGRVFEKEVADLFREIL